MTVYYKATRPDGTDFRTGTIQYLVGHVVEHPTSKRFGVMESNRSSTYLSVSVEPGEVLTGGSWPCRLFRVEPVGRTVKCTDGAYGFKRGCRAMRVVEELPAYEALGPNGAEVAAIIDRAGRLTVDEARRLAAARAAAWDAAWSAAWSAARGAARGASWHAAWDAARGAARGAAWDAAWNAAWDAARGAAWDAAWDAASGALLRDVLAPEHYETLMGPWRSVIGEAKA
jgi:hypothetical protein